MEARDRTQVKARFLLIGGLAFFGLYLASRYSYLLFHSIAEVFSVSVAGTVFMVSWNIRRSPENSYFSLIGIGFLFVAAIGFLHMLAYKGMGVFPGYDANLPTQLWVAARYLLAVSFLAAPAFSRRRLNHRLALAAYFAVASLLIVSIFHWRNFPVCFIEGTGLTPFKKTSEFVISGIFLASIVFLMRRKDHFDSDVLGLLVASAGVSIGAELAFTLYTDVYGLSNLIGHFLAILSYFLAYKAVVGTDLVRRYELNRRLQREVEDRKQAEERARHLASFPQLNPNPVLEVDSSGKVTYCNAATQKVLQSLEMDPGDASPFLPADLDRILGDLEKGNESISFHEMQIKDRFFGTTIHIIHQFHVVRIYAHDITAAKRAEELLVRAKEEWERTFDAMPEMVAILDFNHRIQRVNEAMARRLGRKPQECVGLHCYETVHGMSEPPGFCPHARTLKDGLLHTEEIHEDRLGGDFLVSTTPLFGRQGERIASVHVARDITESKRAAEELRAAKEGLEKRVAERTAELEASAARIQEELEKRMKAEESLERQASLLASVLDSVGDGVVVADRQGKLLFLNPEGQRIVRKGITDSNPDEWAERYGFFLPDKTTACSTERIPLVRAIGGESFDDVELFVRYDPDLDGAWISCSGRPLRNADGALQGGVVAFRDITARKQAERSLRVSMEISEKIFSNIHFCVVYLDAGFNFLRVNQAYADACGHPPGFFTGKNHFDLYPDEENEAVFRKVVATGEPFHVHGKEFEFPDHPEWGITYWDWSLLPLKGPDGDVDGLIFVLVDATERQRASRALQASEEQFRTLVGSSLVGIMIVRNGRIVYMNPEQKKLFGDPPESFELRSFGDVHPEDLGKFEELCDAVLSDGGGSRDMEFRFYPFGRSAEGVDLRWVHCRGTPIRSQGERVFLLNMVDITRMKEMEHQFLVREKMASLGHVAAGIAHEIRNPLSGINIHLSALEKAIEDDGGLGAESREQAGRIIEQIKSASERIESVIRKVMDFSRARAPRLGRVDINMAIEEAIDFSTTFLRKRGITLDRSRLAAVPKCPADTSLITQVVMNLITNAAQALENAPGSKVIEVSCGALEGRIFICVSDSGPGVPPAIREKIFDPFYTTRRDGYGIGLSFSRRVIAEHEGILTVGSGRLGGAEFRIELPLNERENPAPAEMGDGTVTRQ